MAVDLTVAAIPVFFGGMGAEHLWLKRTAAERGVTPGDYERKDTIASLAMGTGSLVAPLLMRKLLEPVTPGKGRYAKVLVGTAIGAAVATSVADVIARRNAGPLPEAGVVPGPAAVVEPADAGPDAAPTGNRAQRRLGELARKVASSAGATAVVAGGVAIATAWGTRTAGKKLFDQRLFADKGDDALAVAGAILGWDFIYYWNHRLAHESRHMWAFHVVHHSSEHYNLSTALRQPVADVFVASIPYTALALLGYRPEVIETARGVNLLYQFWIHTEAVRRIGPFEHVFNSASLHRVHHGSNRKYLDRNHGSILIIWDRLFGTHQVEEEPVVYGLTKNIDSYNVATIATHEYRDMVNDVRSSTTWRERLSFVFRGPGWAYERRAETEARTEALPVDVPEPVAAGVA